MTNKVFELYHLALVEGHGEVVSGGHHHHPVPWRRGHGLAAGGETLWNLKFVFITIPLLCTVSHLTPVPVFTQHRLPLVLDLREEREMGK